MKVNTMSPNQAGAVLSWSILFALPKNVNRRENQTIKDMTGG